MTDTATALPTRFLQIGDQRIAYDDTGGEGGLVLAIPGMGDLRSQYRHIRPVLVAAGHRVVTMDVRGFGEASTQWDDYSAHAVGRDALALIDHLGAASAVILGNSFAAGSALWAAHDAPEKVRGVVLLGPIVRDQKVPAVAKLALDIGFAGPWRRWFWTTYWNSLFPAAKPADHPQAKAALARNLGAMGGRPLSGSAHTNDLGSDDAAVGKHHPHHRRRIRHRQGAGPPLARSRQQGHRRRPQGRAAERDGRRP